MAEPIGTIVRMQVQAEPLKATGVYDPTYLVTVDEAFISSEGMLGWDGAGWVVDAHHAAHPRSRGGGRRALSIGLTGHYRDMSGRFAAATVGIGGENIIIDGPALRLPEIANGFLIRRPDGIELLAPRPAAPCVEFTSYLLGSDEVLPRGELVEDMAFLSEGTRGQIVDVDHLTTPVLLGVGDEVFLR